MKATACAHPVQGLIKNFGLADDRQCIPFYDSISVCCAPLHSITTVQFQSEQEILVNGNPPDARTLKRIDAVISEIKRLSGIQGEVKVISRDNFPVDHAHDASAMIAALTLAAAEAADIDLSPKELSRIARKGTGAAPSSVAGYFSRWKAYIEERSCYASVLEDDMDMGMVAAFITPLAGKTDCNGMLTSHLLEFRLKTVHASLYEMEQAIRSQNIPQIGFLAEKESIMVHALSTGVVEDMIPWNPDAQRVMAEVQALREDGIEVYLNMDTGPVYINCFPEDCPLIEGRMRKLKIPVARLQVGKGAHRIRGHLF
jgi:phosphomevalonate decarboxylase